MTDDPSRSTIRRNDSWSPASTASTSRRSSVVALAARSASQALSVVTSPVRCDGGPGLECRSGTGPGPAIIAGRTGPHRRTEVTGPGAEGQPSVVRASATVVARPGPGARARPGVRPRVVATVVARLILALVVAVLVVGAVVGARVAAVVVALLVLALVVAVLVVHLVVPAVVVEARLLVILRRRPVV